MEGERVDHTLQATALANEVFLRLFSLDADKARNPEGATRWFVANAVIAIRQVLVDHARGVGRQKRGGGRRPVSLAGMDAPERGPSLDPEVADRIRTVDVLLSELAAVSALQSEIVALRFFGGLTFAQIAAQVDVPETTVRREWALARIWMGKSRAAAGWGIDA
jgi:RNA polymerase sigma factor (TIGR02999 family)